MKRTKGLILLLCAVLLLGMLTPTVQAKKFNAKEAKKKVTVTYHKTQNGILAIYKNKNKTALKLTATMKFLVGNDSVLEKTTKVNYCLGGKTSGTIFFPTPRNEYGDYINYSNYKASFKVAKSTKKSYSKKIAVSSELKGIEGAFTAVNMSGKTLSNIDATIVFYDNNDNLLGCQTANPTCFKPNDMDQFTVTYPSGMGTPSKVKVYINSAY